MSKRTHVVYDSPQTQNGSIIVPIVLATENMATAISSPLRYCERSIPTRRIRDTSHTPVGVRTWFPTALLAGQLTIGPFVNV